MCFFIYNICLFITKLTIVYRLKYHCQYQFSHFIINKCYKAFFYYGNLTINSLAMMCECKNIENVHWYIWSFHSWLPFELDNWFGLVLIIRRISGRAPSNRQHVKFNFHFVRLNLECVIFLFVEYAYYFLI